MNETSSKVSSAAGPESDLLAHRNAIDALDREILSRLNQRASHAHAIGKLKGESVAYRPEREAQVLANMRAQNTGPLSNEAVTQVFRAVMSVCLALEQKLKVAYLGPIGTFTQAAVIKHFGESVGTEPCMSIDEVFRAAESGQVDYAVVPVENSTEGVVGRTLDLMFQTPLLICGEIRLAIHHNFLVAEGELGGVKKVYSHAQSLAQCALWLARHAPAAQRLPVASNAEAARLASIEPHTAAIAGAAAAGIYKLRILASNIEDEPNNTTRFWVLGKTPVRRSGNDETSLVMSAHNRPGAVYELLEPFARHGVSMSRLESRPSRGVLWEYLFFVDLEGHQEDPSVAAALADLRSQAPFLKILGSYPGADV